jgi:hypothetical protein
VPVETIQVGLTVAASPLTQQASEAFPQLGLLELGPLEEFEGDPEAHAGLVRTLIERPDNFDYRLATCATGGVGGQGSPRPGPLCATADTRSSWTTSCRTERTWWKVSTPATT